VSHGTHVWGPAVRGTRRATTLDSGGRDAMVFAVGYYSLTAVELVAGVLVFT